MTKFIFVTGGVVSGLGKGIAAASIGLLLKNKGLKVAVEKFDPYLNVDPGTMSPYQHGEVFVTEDGGETDLDLGHYERFIGDNLVKECSLSSGQIYSEIINKERKGDYLGGTVQVVPHVTDIIKNRIRNLAESSDADVVITEIGGTVGEIEAESFLESIRQFRSEIGGANALFIHLTLIPFLKLSGELKTKPTQHSVKELQRHGINPDMIICRSEISIPDELLDKVATFCNVDRKYVFEGIDVDTIYDVPINFHENEMEERICERLGIPTERKNIDKWKTLVNNYKNPEKEVKIAIVGKYVALADAYLSVSESLKHAGAYHKCKVNIEWVNSEDIELDGADKYLTGLSGILVPGGFGNRGIEGKIMAAKYARENKIPYLGICLGMQIAVIEFARNVCGLKDANSSEFGLFEHQVIDLMEKQVGVTNKGGTMRLGSYPCTLKENTLAYKAYGEMFIDERHRHRYEFNNTYRDILKNHGMILAGTSPDNMLVEIIELKDHPWFVASQFHPEFKSRLYKPHPLFRDFVGVAVKN
ncbi:MAG: CTP synthase [Clostridiales bacterium GWE2_32_10]|nr:MAG: CTP synthase [Clostridiales bacterium GWE2_32_10]HBY21633.1 CTP synthase [Clostridiales bacterium]